MHDVENIKMDYSATGPFKQKELEEFYIWSLPCEWNFFAGGKILSLSQLSIDFHINDVINDRPLRNGTEVQNEESCSKKSIRETFGISNIYFLLIWACYMPDFL